MNTNTAPAPDLATVADLMPACEGWTHAAGLYGHVPSDPASVLVIAPCGLSWFACAGWVAYSQHHETIACERCGHHLTVLHAFLRLD